MDYTNIAESMIISISSIIVALISAGYFKDYLDRKKIKSHKKSIVSRIHKDELIHFALKELRRKYSCDRIYIIQYHNGGNFYTNSPMQKSTMTYEYTVDGLERLAERYQNVLVSHFTWLLKQTIENNMFYYKVNEITDIYTRGLFISHGAQSCISLPIYDNEKNLTGIIGMEWVFSKIPNTFIEDNNFSKNFIKEVKKEVDTLNLYV